MIAFILACWIFCPDCPPPPHFSVNPLPKYSLNFTQTVQTFYLDNGQSRPMYYFKFEGLYPCQKLTMPHLKYFSYAHNPVYAGKDGVAIILAFTNTENPVPPTLHFNIDIDGYPAVINAPSSDVN